MKPSLESLSKPGAKAQRGYAVYPKIPHSCNYTFGIYTAALIGRDCLATACLDDGLGACASSCSLNQRTRITRILLGSRPAVGCHHDMPSSSASAPDPCKEASMHAHLIVEQPRALRKPYTSCTLTLNDPIIGLIYLQFRVNRVGFSVGSWG